MYNRNKVTVVIMSHLLSFYSKWGKFLGL